MATSEPLPLFNSLSTWDLLNLRPDDILSIPDRLAHEYGISSEFLEKMMSKYIVQSTGMGPMEKELAESGIEMPKLLIASTKHYSWPKATGS